MMITRLFFIILFVLALSMVGNVQAVNLWFNADVDNLWTTVGNWSAADPNQDRVPVYAEDWAKPRDGDTAYIYSGVDAECKKVAIGACTPAEGVSGLTVDGGTLTMNEDIVPGRNGDGLFTLISGTVNCRDIDAGYDQPVPDGDGGIGYVSILGGIANLSRDMEIPDNSGRTGYVTVSGGTVNIADDLDMNASGGIGGLDLIAGTINVNDDLQMVVGGTSIDIKFGTLIIGDSGTGNDTTVADAIARGALTGFGIAGNVNVVDDGDTITITAIADPLDRTPTMDENVSTNAVLPLSWINPPTAPVTVDVWFGTDATWIPDLSDPNFPDAGDYVDFVQIEDNALNLTSTTVDASVDLQQYVWRVDTLGADVPGDPNGYIEGLLMRFTAYDDVPVKSVVMEGGSMVTWAGEPISLEATITDDGESALSVVWSAVDNSDPGVELTEPNAVFTNEALVDNGDGTFTATADVTIDYHAAQFTVTATASDLSGGASVSGSQQHDCAATACQAARVLGYGDAHPADIAVDCVLTLVDFAALAEDWVADYALTSPEEIPQI